MVDYNELKEFYHNKKVLITGHTGFKGSWLCEVLKFLGANVVGYALEPPTFPSLYELLNIESTITSYIGDIRDLASLMRVFDIEKPQVVIHMAAQPLVRESYADPVGTYEMNVMGTVNVLECCRKCDSVRSIVNVTTDKVYRNNEWARGYVETDELCGYDPYSNSKSCSELVTDSYRNAFFNSLLVPVSTVRAGNVIGGGDFATDRIIPDCVRAVINGTDIVVRNPHSTRPYQHVLEPLMVYLMVAMAQCKDYSLSGCYNVGPNDESILSTGELVTLFCKQWNEKSDKKISWVNQHDGGPHEANILKLDSTKLKKAFDWKPHWNIVTTMEKIVEWNEGYLFNKNISEIVEQQIKTYFMC